MNNIKTSRHIGNLVTDYVLDCLPAGEKNEISRHIASCADCRRLVSIEEQVGFLVRSTISVTGQNQAMLRALMPPVPERNPGIFNQSFFNRQLAVAAVILVVFLAGLNVVFKQEMSGYSAPISTAYLATASPTNTPAAATLSPTPSLESVEGDSLTQPGPMEQLPLVTPAPPPIAAQ